MGGFDSIKDKVTELVDGQGQAVGEGVDKAGDLVDDRTGGQYADKVDLGQGKAKDAFDALDGQDDDIS
ncbi:antitoxin [Pedococcus sp. 5OH_020]|uniref:antitoxin n=1 Tax=Pedococcus sp. 5OH_020 TaxID=2989814 RepID=UPI0022E9B74E|nr:antitoxin [Pedococcus sp. 5OH_020]